MITFEGEALFERKDDNVIIQLQEFKLKKLKDDYQEATIIFDSD